MSNMKIVALIDHEVRRVAHDDEAARIALASDLYAALVAVTEPLIERIVKLEREIGRLRDANYARSL